MPANIVKPGQEEYWERAKRLAAKEGRSGDYAYITGIFKRMVVNKALAGLDVPVSALKKSLGLVVPPAYRTARGHGSGSVERERLLLASMEKKPPKFSVARLFDHTGPRSGPADIVKGLFGPDLTKAGEWETFLEKTFASATDELAVRRALFEKAREDALDPAQRRALFQRSMSFWRDTQKSLIQVVTADELAKADARGGSYHRRVRTEKGGYRYYYDEDKYRSSKHHQVSGDDAAKAYVGKAVTSRVQKAGEKGCGPEEMADLVKRYGKDVVAGVLRQSCGEGGGLVHQKGRFYASQSAS